jgi:hypothetical protein
MGELTIMKARRIFVSVFIILTFALSFINGCTSKSDSPSSDSPSSDTPSSDTPSSAKAITAFSLNGVAGTINETEKTIAVAMPSLTNVYSLAATFTTTGASVTIGTTTQKSGVTVNNFIAPVTYTVTAADGSTVTYTVTVTINRAWHNPANLGDNISPDGQGTDIAQVAMDKNGNAIIVWAQYDGANSQIFKSEYRNGLWTYPADLRNKISPDGDARNPRVAMDDNGNAIIIWSEYYGANYQMFKSEYRNGAWTNPANLSDHFSPNSVPDSPWPLSCQVAMDNNGNAIIVWVQPDGPRGMIFKSEYRNGVWHHPASLSDKINPTGISASDPQVAMDNNGNAIIVWYQYDYIKTTQIFKSEYRNGAWHNPATLTDNISLGEQWANSPQVTMDNNGNAIIVWDQSDGVNEQIFKSEYRGGVWTNPANLADNISPDGQDARNAKVAMDNSGNAIIVWHQSDGSHKQIFKSEYRNGAWHNPASLSDNISPDGQDAYFYTQVAMDNNGNAIIVWNQFDGASYQIFKSEYRSGLWTCPANLSDNISPDGQDAFYPYAAMNNIGNAIIVWCQSDGTKDQIFKSEYR